MNRTPQMAAATPSALSPDRDAVLYIGRHGVVSIAHLMAALRIGRTAAYDRVASLIDAGLLERLDLLRGQPSLLRATRAGLRYAGLGMSPAVVSPGAVDHWLRCASVGLRLEARHGAHRVLTERELLVAERHEDHPIASAKVGELPDGRPRLHRPDLVVLPEGHPLTGGRSVHVSESASCPAAHARTRQRGGSDPSDISGGHQREGSEAEAFISGGEITSCDERALPGAEDMRVDDGRALAEAEEMGAGVIAVEVELTTKSPKRLRQIIRGWRRATWVSEVHYLCEAGQTRRAVERAVEKLHARDRVQVAEVPRARSEQASNSDRPRREQSASRCSQ